MFHVSPLRFVFGKFIANQICMRKVFLGPSKPVSYFNRTGASFAADIVAERQDIRDFSARGLATSSSRLLLTPFKKVRGGLVTSEPP